MGRIKDNVRDKHFNFHAFENEFIAPFLYGFNVNWGSRMDVSNTQLSVYILEPEDYVKEGFGINREILAVYAPYDKMEARTIQAVEKLFEKTPIRGRVENLNYFLISDDLNVKVWLEEYLSDTDSSRVIIPFSKEELIQNKGDAWFVRNRLIENFYGKDLFGNYLPLTEDTFFFGRRQIIANHIEAVKDSANRGIFGLRKTGKTSLLFKIGRTVIEERLGHVFFYDCKSPSIRKLTWNKFLTLITRNISQRLNLKDFFIDDDEIKVIQSFRKVMKIAQQRRMKVVLMFDEIEYVSFKAIRDKHWHEQFIDFWQTIWSTQSLHKNLVFFIAGVNPTVVEVDLIDGIQNPLFGIVKTEYLKGFEYDEMKTMVKTLGRRMGLQFDFESLKYIHKWYGGHPMLTRLACSWINENIDIQNESRPILINKNRLINEQQERDTDLTFYCNHVVSELKLFYEEEYQMLELLASAQLSEFAELSAYHEFVKHLKSYGLLKYDEYQNPSIAIPVVGRYVGLELARKEGRNNVLMVVEENKRINWLAHRVEAIIRDLRSLEKVIERNSFPYLFGPNSFPEAERFKAISVASDWNSFIVFINVMNRCFVESIETYGGSTGRRNYFWDTIKEEYPSLFYSLKRIKTYRNEQDHLKLTNSVNEQLSEFLSIDLENRKLSQVKDLYFVLQQRTVDNFLTSIHLEMNKIG